MTQDPDRTRPPQGRRLYTDEEVAAMTRETPRDVRPGDRIYRFGADGRTIVEETLVRPSFEEIWAAGQRDAQAEAAESRANADRVPDARPRGGNNGPRR